jgi:hypothetical protein
LVNTDTAPTSVTQNKISLIDVIITNNDHHEKLATVVYLGYSDHKSQILHLNIYTLIRGHKKVKTRQFTEKSIEEFIHLLNKESR